MTTRDPLEPTEEGWYMARAHHRHEMEPVHVQRDADTGRLLVIRCPEAVTFDTIAEWGPNIAESIVLLANLQWGLQAADVTADPAGICELQRRANAAANASEVARVAMEWAHKRANEATVRLMQVDGQSAQRMAELLERSEENTRIDERAQCEMEIARYCRDLIKEENDVPVGDRALRTTAFTLRVSGALDVLNRIANEISGSRYPRIGIERASADVRVFRYLLRWAEDGYAGDPRARQRARWSWRPRCDQDLVREDARRVHATAAGEEGIAVMSDLRVPTKPGWYRARWRNATMMDTFYFDGVDKVVQPRPGAAFECGDCGTDLLVEPGSYERLYCPNVACGRGTLCTRRPKAAPQIEQPTGECDMATVAAKNVAAWTALLHAIDPGLTWGRASHPYDGYWVRDEVCMRDGRKGNCWSVGKVDGWSAPGSHPLNSAIMTFLRSLRAASTEFWIGVPSSTGDTPPECDGGMHEFNDGDDSPCQCSLFARRSHLPGVDVTDDADDGIDTRDPDVDADWPLPDARMGWLFGGQWRVVVPDDIRGLPPIVRARVRATANARNAAAQRKAGSKGGGA